MIETYIPFIDRLISRYEGPYGWDRNDSGGPTKYGITCWDLAQHRGQRMNSMAAWAPIVKAMPLDEAEDIYAEKYAKACDFDRLPAGPDCCLLDFDVNSGSGRGIRYAQRIVDVNRDGVMGPVTISAIRAYDPTKFVDNLCDDRLHFLRSLRIWGTFGNGWTARVVDLRRYCHGVISTYAPAVALSLAALEADEGYTEKTTRLPMAFPKGYSEEHLAALEAANAPA